MLFSRVHFKQGKKSDDEDTDPNLLKKNVILKEDRRLSKDYVIGEYLGSGKFGEVKRCEEKQTGGQFAAKFVPIASDDDWKSVQNEIAIMNRLRHPRLIQLYDAYSRKSEVIMVLELITGGELFERIIDESFDLNESRCIRFMNEILQGVEYMHNQGVLHLDLKPENILCLSRTSFKIKIIDFGLARFYDGKEMCVLFGTPEFVSPEVISYEPVCPAADMWSVGVICYVMLSGLSPFMGDSQGETLANIMKVTYDFNYPEFDEISEEARNFIRKLLIKDPKKRMTATECLQHPWIKKKRQLKRKGTVSKKRLKHFVYRRKWQKAVNAIIALLRMGVVLQHPYQSTENRISHPANKPSATSVAAPVPTKQLPSKREDLQISESLQSPKGKTRRTSLKAINNTLFGRITSKRQQSPASRKTSVQEDESAHPKSNRSSPKPSTTSSRRSSILNKFTRGGTSNSIKSKSSTAAKPVTPKDSTSPVQVKLAEDKLPSKSSVASNTKDSTKSKNFAFDGTTKSELTRKPVTPVSSSPNERSIDSKAEPPISKVDLKPKENMVQSNTCRPSTNSSTIVNKTTTPNTPKSPPATQKTTTTVDPSPKSKVESMNKTNPKPTSAPEAKNPHLLSKSPKPVVKKALPQGSSIATRIGFFSSLTANSDKGPKKA